MEHVGETISFAWSRPSRGNRPKDGLYGIDGLAEVSEVETTYCLSKSRNRSRLAPIIAANKERMAVQDAIFAAEHMRKAAITRKRKALEETSDSPAAIKRKLHALNQTSAAAKAIKRKFRSLARTSELSKLEALNIELAELLKAELTALHKASLPRGQVLEPRRTRGRQLTLNRNGHATAATKFIKYVEREVDLDEVLLIGITANPRLGSGARKTRTKIDIFIKKLAEKLDPGAILISVIEPFPDCPTDGHLEATVLLPGFRPWQFRQVRERIAGYWHRLWENEPGMWVGRAIVTKHLPTFDDVKGKVLYQLDPDKAGVPDEMGPIGNRTIKRGFQHIPSFERRRQDFEGMGILAFANYLSACEERGYDPGHFGPARFLGLKPRFRTLSEATKYITGKLTPPPAGHYYSLGNPWLRIENGVERVTLRCVLHKVRALGSGSVAAEGSVHGSGREVSVRFDWSKVI